MTQGLSQPSATPQRIVVLNPKGGSGKTTLAVNIAGYMAWRGHSTALMDHDPQGSSTRWVRKRKPPQPPIHGIATFERDGRTTRAWQLRVPEGTQRIVVDTPAAVDPQRLPELVKDAHKIIVPVLPSDIDLHACSRCIADLLLVAKIKRDDNRIGVVANRVRKNTLVYQSLMRFLATLKIPVIATIRDSQNYVRSAELGVSIHEMKPYVVRDDIEQWQSLIAWIEGTEARSSAYEHATALVTLPPQPAANAPVASSRDAVSTEAAQPIVFAAG
jgi:chromosome partitioning protein